MFLDVCCLWMEWCTLFSKYTDAIKAIKAMDKYDLPPDREAGIFLKASISWKGWKYRLRKIKERSRWYRHKNANYLWLHIQVRMGRCPFPAMKPSLVYGCDGKGRVRGLGIGVTKTVIHAAAPYK
ncbi:hypothetical protein IFM89_009161 [Coptis chinensis]|uniref:Uncharacterized protein n=1 Tax=Coptis chinensis TaxID=261450 RepID=A0A835IZ91_9MAGN|nr:hypothetical protein IFM89_009161 [Coptis chinensis]